MSSSIERRLASLEGKKRHYRSVHDIPRAELEEKVRPLFGGRVPTLKEIEDYLARAEANGETSEDTE